MKNFAPKMNMSEGGGLHLHLHMAKPISKGKIKTGMGSLFKISELMGALKEGALHPLTKIKKMKVSSQK